jgi:hypothetical protein
LRSIYFIELLSSNIFFGSFRDLHCHRVGYDNKKLPKNVRESYRLQAAEASPPLDLITAGTTTPLKHTSNPKSSQASMSLPFACFETFFLLVCAEDQGCFYYICNRNHISIIASSDNSF